MARYSLVMESVELSNYGIIMGSTLEALASSLQVNRDSSCQVKPVKNTSRVVKDAEL